MKNIVVAKNTLDNKRFFLNCLISLNYIGDFEEVEIFIANNIEYDDVFETNIIIQNNKFKTLVPFKIITHKKSKTLYPKEFLELKYQDEFIETYYKYFKTYQTFLKFSLEYGFIQVYSLKGFEENFKEDIKNIFSKPNEDNLNIFLNNYKKYISKKDIYETISDNFKEPERFEIILK